MRESTVRVGVQRGYNLIEVIIAMALLSMVLLAIMSLFVMGQRNVYSGKKMTEAATVGGRVLEDLQSQSVDDIQKNFAIADGATLGTVDVDTSTTMGTDTYTKSILRRSDTIAAGQDPEGFLQSWQDQIEGELAKGYVAVVFTPKNPDPPTAAVTMGNATVLRIRVITRWVEGTRTRETVFDTVKFRRP